MVIETITVDQEMKILSFLDLYIDQKDKFGFSCVPKSPTVKQVKSIRNVCAFILMIDAGLRVNEVTHLLLSDCYFNCMAVNQLTVRASIAKKNRERTVPCTDRLRCALDRLFPFTCPRAQHDHPIHVISRNSIGDSLSTSSLQRHLV